MIDQTITQLRQMKLIGMTSALVSQVEQPCNYEGLAFEQRLQLLADSGLIRADGARYVLSETGLKVGKAQASAQKKISASAQRVVIKFVYLNQSAGDRCCGTFLLNWIPDSDLDTFVYERSVSDGTEILTWLRVLERVGMISVDTDQAYVNKEYLKSVKRVISRNKRC